MSKETEKSIHFLKEKFALDISMYDNSFLQKGIRNRMAVTRIWSAASYSTASLGKVTLKRIQTYFTKHGETYTIVPQLRDYTDFSIFNLFSENGTCPPASIYGNFDLVFINSAIFQKR